ncbi:MAG: NAD(P)-dependent alcohol dehydrogenase [Deltaproteobacteria bacterium]|nr:NAD(P)-dependent alcohol dehydrogenase [Deltaproteobacteria bacterium]
MRVMTSTSPSAPLAPVDLPSRPLGAGEVRVAVRAIGVNPVDWKMRSGGPLRFAHRLLGPSGPLVVGVDFAGEVIEVGTGVTGLAPGDRVVGGTNFGRKQYGSYADEVIVRPDQCAVLPPEVTYEKAACLPVAAVTPWMSLTRLSPVSTTPDARVLILGASGGVGLMAIQLSKLLGAHPVGVCSARNVDLVESYGAVAIDYGAGDALEAAKEHGPYHLVLQAVGTDKYPLAKCRSLLAPGGRVTLVVIRPADYLAFTFLPSVNTVLGRPDTATLEPLVAALAAGKLDPLIAKTYPLEQAESAHIESQGGKVVGKLLLLP